MSQNMVSLLIPVITVIISVLTSVFITAIRNKAELAKIQKETELRYSKSLFDKRIEIYPELYNSLSSYDKLIQYNKQSIESLREFRDKVDEWNSRNSLFFTEATTKISSRFRKYLRILLQRNQQNTISNEDWNDIQKIIVHFEHSLKAEIGIYDTKAVGLIKDIERIYKFIDDKSILIS